METYSEEIQNKFIEFLGEIEGAAIIKANDFTDERLNNMIIVGISDVQQMNFGLPDFQYSMQIIVDTFINEDKDGELFKATCKKVEDKIFAIDLDRSMIGEAFGNMPVVYFQLEGNSVTIDPDTRSNRSLYRIKLIASF